MLKPRFRYLSVLKTTLIHNLNEMANKKGNNATVPQTKQNKQVESNDSKDYSSLKVVLFYCSLIVCMPVGTFFFLNSIILDKFLTLSPMATNIYSAAGAVVMLHLALGLYIYRAYFGEHSSKKTD